MAGSHGGAWKVAYADFVTAMMAFFLVMWIVAQNKPVKEAVAQYFRSPFSSPHAGSPGPRIAVEGGGLSNLRSLATGQRGHSRGLGHAGGETPASGGAKGGPPRTSVHDEDALRSGATVLFDEESAELDAQARDQLRAMIPGLLGKPNKIEIRGHATGRPLPAGSRYADAWQLSYARCQAALKFFVENGIEPNRVRLSQGGAFEPQAHPGEIAWTAQNSRVEVYMLGEFVHAVRKTSQQRP